MILSQVVLQAPIELRISWLFLSILDECNHFIIIYLEEGSLRIAVVKEALVKVASEIIAPKVEMSVFEVNQNKSSLVLMKYHCIVLLKVIVRDDKVSLRTLPGTHCLIKEAQIIHFECLHVFNYTLNVLEYVRGSLVSFNFEGKSRLHLAHILAEPATLLVHGEVERLVRAWLLDAANELQ